MGRPLKSIKPMFKRDKWNIVRGDMVQIMAGKAKGMQGKVLRVIRDVRRPRVVVEGQNLIKRRIPAQNGQPGFPVTMESPLHYSNVMLLDPNSERPVRTAMFYDDNSRVRITKGRHASRTHIAKPDEWRAQENGDNRVGEKDTAPEAALKVTYNPSSDFNISWPTTGSQRRSFRTDTTSSSSSNSSSNSAGNVRGFAASALQDAGCSCSHADGTKGRLAGQAMSQQGGVLGRAVMPLGQSRRNSVLWLVRNIHTTTASSSSSSSSGADTGNTAGGTSSVAEARAERHIEDLTATLASDLRRGTQQAGGWAAMAAWRWMRQRLA